MLAQKVLMHSTLRGGARFFVNITPIRKKKTEDRTTQEVTASEYMCEDNTYQSDFNLNSINVHDSTTGTKLHL